MGIKETSYPRFIAVCNSCGSKTFPVAHSKTEARHIAHQDHGFVFSVDVDNNEVCHCPSCAKKPKR